MAYDEPMSLEEALQDPETRRRAFAMIGMDESVPVPLIGPGTGNQIPEPTGATGTTSVAPTGDLVGRYLAAQGEDRRQQRINDLNEGFGNAAQTILGAAGVPYARGRSAQPRAAADVLDLERVRAAGTKKADVGGRPAKTSTDPHGPESQRLQAFARSRWPQEDADVIGAIVPETFESIRKTLDAKYGIQSREGLAGKTAEQRAQEHKDKIRIAAQRLGLDERKLEQAMTMLGMRLEDSEADREARTKIAEDAAEAKATARVEDQAKEYGVKYAEGGFPEFREYATEADRLFSKYPSGLPGVGIAAGRVPRRFTTEDGKLLRTISGQMLLAYKKSVTGLGSSVKEDEAIRNATGLIQTGDDESLKLGVKVLKTVMDAKEAALKAGYKQEAVDAVIARLPSPGRGVVTTSPAAAPPRATAGKPVGGKPERRPVRRVPSKDRKWMRLEYSDGTSEVVPNG